ncbi:hypothetical protein [Flavobacterium proteolyticum]|uniref:Uncharacterized protein n=1 Tax=Flavobacterium proteolyticum TaxID=2911683 RepID=A0ABR9WVA9_9FLAO|nr:hypothetical protein [Flavobacterium proteolyticum]MBE9577573.1 hypothetical protein [Flavobacterium proteolyticum]
MEKPTTDEIIDFLLNTLSDNKFKNVDSKLIRQKFNLTFSSDDIDLIKNSLIKAENKSLIELNQNKSFAKLTEIGVSVKNVGWLVYLEYEKAKKLDEIEIESIKKDTLKVDLKLKKWQIKTFWCIFGIAIIGSGLSVYNFINNLFPSRNEEKQEEQIIRMESELSKLRTLVLDQRKVDSLRNSNSYIKK